MHSNRFHPPCLGWGQFGSVGYDEAELVFLFRGSVCLIGACKPMPWGRLPVVSRMREAPSNPNHLRPAYFTGGLQSTAEPCLGGDVPFESRGCSPVPFDVVLVSNPNPLLPSNLISPNTYNVLSSSLNQIHQHGLGAFNPPLSSQI
jgi:hypothetical protein